MSSYNHQITNEANYLEGLIWHPTKCRLAFISFFLLLKGTTLTCDADLVSTATATDFRLEFGQKMESRQLSLSSSNGTLTQESYDTDSALPARIR